MTFMLRKCLRGQQQHQPGKQKSAFNQDHFTSPWHTDNGLGFRLSLALLLLFCLAASAFTVFVFRLGSSIAALCVQLTRITAAAVVFLVRVVLAALGAFFTTLGAFFTAARRSFFAGTFRATARAFRAARFGLLLLISLRCALGHADGECRQ
ncbi:MAG TPA: hypothetical protein VHH35_18220 [Pyrinomonadaceae bacterium]|nr:hypothetical protein [Pyrinomonadaceae bacterium]